MGVSTYFDSRFKFRVHITQLCLIVLVIILSIARVSMKDAPPQRAHTMGIAIGLKSIIFILFQVLTEHTLRFQKWANKKTNFILNCVDIPFWAVMMGLLLSANGSSCVGGSCAVSWIMALLAIALL
ncbi:hypothetical protein K445DRAFT_92710 [Daldinia sp. EC12]|nr:hypothetical protein K445DRAFT_92710 [Daldinia sp. EC12]